MLVQGKVVVNSGIESVAGQDIQIEISYSGQYDSPSAVDSGFLDYDVDSARIFSDERFLSKSDQFDAVEFMDDLEALADQFEYEIQRDICDKN